MAAPVAALAGGGRRVLHPLALNLVVQLVFGGYSVFTSVALRDSTVSPLVFSFVRDGVAAVVLLAAAHAAESRAAPSERRFWPERADASYFILLGFLGVWGTQGMSALALEYVPATFFALCIPLQPVIAMSLSLALGLEVWKPRAWTSYAKVGGLALTVAGAIVLAALSGAGGARSVLAASKNFTLGSVYTAIQVLSGASYQTLQKPLLGRYSPIVVAAWGYAAGAALLGATVLPCASSTAPAAWAFGSSPLALGAVLYAALLCSAFNYWAMAYINHKSNPVLLTAFQPLQGLIGALLAWLLLGQPLGAGVAAGGAAIAAGLVVTCAAKLIEDGGGAGGDAGADGKAAAPGAGAGGGGGGGGGGGASEALLHASVNGEDGSGKDV